MANIYIYYCRTYNRIIELKPSHIEAHHNLCVAQVEEGDLKGAEACLLKVYKMAPHLDYVQGKFFQQKCH